MQSRSKYLEDKIKQIQNNFSNPRDIFKSAKNFLEKHNTKEDSSKTTISKFLNKIPDRKKTSRQQCNFCKAKISLEVHGM